MLKESQKAILLDIADDLISTLGSIEAHEADKKVKLCAERIMNEVLDVPGKVAKDKHYFIDYYSKPGEQLITYKFVSD